MSMYVCTFEIFPLNIESMNLRDILKHSACMDIEAQSLPIKVIRNTSHYSTKY